MAQGHQQCYLEAIGSKCCCWDNLTCAPSLATLKGLGNNDFVHIYLRHLGVFIIKVPVSYGVDTWFLCVYLV